MGHGVEIEWTGRAEGEQEGGQVMVDMVMTVFPTVSACGLDSSRVEREGIIRWARMPRLAGCHPRVPRLHGAPMDTGHHAPWVLARRG